MLGTVDTLLADAGYYIEGNTACYEQSGVEPHIPPHRDKDNQSFTERFAHLAPLPQGAKYIEWMRNKLKAAVDCTIYAQRKNTVEPVLGIIKQVLEFRRFFLCRLAAVSGEWTLVSIALNMKRMYALRG